MSEASTVKLPDVITYNPEVARQALPFDPFDPDFHADPFPYYRKIREEAGSAFRTAGGVVAVFGYEEAASVMKDPRFGWGVNPMVADQFVENPASGESGRILMFMDPPDHTRIRGLVSKAFTPKMINVLRPKAARYAEELLAKALEESPDGRIDLQQALSRPLPGKVLSDMMDIPAHYHPLFFANTMESGRGLDPGFTLTDEQKAGRNAARDVFINAGIELVAARRADPGDDLISDLVRAEQEGDRLSEWELAMLMMNLLAAGFGATAALIGNQVYNLLSHPEQLTWLRSHPDHTSAAVEELLRYDSALAMVTRTALEDADVAGIPVRAGEYVVVMLAAANRDPAAFDAPERLDVTRPGTRNLGFGHGIHFCVAAPVARMIAQEALAALIKHDVRLDETRQVVRWPGISLRVIGELPIVLGPVVGS
ncbi:cytochrome P450 [Streptomyces glomeratus]|uniref:Cytochrome P450 n=1 Tax=Streptomyces glomeratus TaxID=284452 RepID=A0ABP6LSX7_9ACTN|nr:cytochrome P450 [Streptomyces glomeratus]MCF1512181.1 cytochrome P450 [Streptomyces glomeratus]